MESARILASAIVLSDSMQEIALDSPPVTSHAGGHDAKHFIPVSVFKTKSEKELSLRHWGLRARSAVVVGELLQHVNGVDSALMRIDMSYNNIGSEGARVLGCVTLGVRV